MQISWSLKPFQSLQLSELYDIIALREQVFIVEQKILALDADGKDPHCWHLLGVSTENERILAYLRLVPPGLKFQEPAIGRVVVAQEARGIGLGQTLMREGLTRCQELWPEMNIRISGQAYLEKFYQTLGFETVQGPYIEEGIPHLEMLFTSPSRTQSDQEESGS